MDTQNSSTGLIRYDAMCHAVAECKRVDEAKDLRDKAKAIEVYAKQAQNYDVERQAGEVRLRAERQAGILLREMKTAGARQKPGDNPRGINGRATQPLTTQLPPKLSDLGISKDQSSKWQQLADVPQKKFEEILKEPGPRPTTEGILNRGKPNATQKMHLDPDALWVYGQVMGFKRQSVLSLDASELYQKMQDFQREQVAEVVPQLIRWLKEFK